MSRFAHAQACILKSLALMFFKFLICNPRKSYPSLTILVPLWFIINSLVFFSLSKLLFSGFLKFKAKSKYRHWVLLSCVIIVPAISPQMLFQWLNRARPEKSNCHLTLCWLLPSNPTWDFLSPQHGCQKEKTEMYQLTLRLSEESLPGQRMGGVKIVLV